MVDISDIKKAEDPIKHATETYLWIIEKGLCPHMYAFLKKYFCSGSKDFLCFLLRINILKKEKTTEEPFK